MLCFSLLSLSLGRSCAGCHISRMVGRRSMVTGHAYSPRPLVCQDLGWVSWVGGCILDLGTRQFDTAFLIELRVNGRSDCNTIRIRRERNGVRNVRQLGATQDVVTAYEALRHKRKHGIR